MSTRSERSAGKNKISTHSAGDPESDSGFSLLEMSLTLMIAGVVVATAIPGLRHLSGSAKTDATETDLTAAQQYESVYFITWSNYATAAQLKAFAPQVTWTGQLPSIVGSDSVSVDTTPNGAPPNTVLLGEKSGDHSYYWVEMEGNKASFATEKAVVEPTYRVIIGPSWASATSLG